MPTKGVIRMVDAADRDTAAAEDRARAVQALYSCLVYLHREAMVIGATDIAQLIGEAARVANDRLDTAAAAGADTSANTGTTH